MTLPVCNLCHKRHGPAFIHPGYCTNCRERSVSRRPHSILCDACTAVIGTTTASITAEDLFARIARNHTYDYR